MNTTRYLLVCTLGLAALATWATVSPLDIVVRGSGKIVPAMKSQVLQNLEGGIISNILVTEGESVLVGQEIIRLDGSNYGFTVNEMERKLVALHSRLDRLNAELNDTETPMFRHADDPRAKRAIESEQALFNARRADLLVKRETTSRIADLRSSEVDLLRPLVKGRSVSAVDLLRTEILAEEARANAETTVTDFKRAAAEEHAKTLVEIQQIEETIQIKRDQLNRTVIKAPANGYVNRIVFSTVGAVVGPGEDILEITPTDGDLLVEAKISPSDVAFVHPGMEANVKFTAYDYTIFGSFAGEVVHVSSDTLEEQGTQQNVTYYKVIVRLLHRKREDDREITLRPGMVSEVELISGSRTIMQYFLKPLLKASQSLSER